MTTEGESLLVKIQPELQFQDERVDPERTDIVDRFRAAPLGPHDPDVQEVLYVLRSQDKGFRYCLLYHRPNGPWSVMRVPIERGHRAKVLDGQTYGERADAEWAVFKLRWKAHTGREIN